MGFTRANAAEMQLYGLRLMDGEAKRFMPDVYALTSKDPDKQPAPTSDASIYVVDSFLRASVTLLEYLDNWRNGSHEVTSNPTYEKQTQDKPARSVVYDSWKPYRESGRKRTYGNATLGEALAAGLAERPEDSNYIPAKTPEQRREDAKAAKLEKQADDILKRTPKC